MIDNDESKYANTRTIEAIAIIAEVAT